jgi:8-oxo-dGTP pyrophosphatase MutT (NUDIX family)
MLMKREFSAGGIVFNSSGQVLLTQNSSNHYWGFPKGMIDKGESSKEAALREVKEEGGVEANIIQKVNDSKFIYTRNGEKVFKNVTYYLMEYLSGDPKDHDFEVSEAGFYHVSEALEKLSFKSDKDLLHQALMIKDKVGGEGGI